MGSGFESSTTALKTRSQPPVIQRFLYHHMCPVTTFFIRISKNHFLLVCCKKCVYPLGINCSFSNLSMANEKIAKQ